MTGDELREYLGKTLDADAISSLATEFGVQTGQSHLPWPYATRARVRSGLAKLGWSDSLATKLREEEAQLAQLKTLHCSQLVAPERALPERAVIEDFLSKLLVLLEVDPARGREILLKYVPPVVVFFGGPA